MIGPAQRLLAETQHQTGRSGGFEPPEPLGRRQHRTQQILAAVGGAGREEHARGRSVRLRAKEERAARDLPEQLLGPGGERAGIVLRPEQEPRPRELTYTADALVRSPDLLAGVETALENVGGLGGCTEVEQCPSESLGRPPRPRGLSGQRHRLSAGCQRFLICAAAPV